MFETSKPIKLASDAATEAVASLHFNTANQGGKITRNAQIVVQRGLKDSTGNFVSVGPALTKTYNEAQLTAAQKPAAGATPSEENKSLAALIAAIEAHGAAAGL
ncbi:MAG TPA: hypothetical protein VGM54_02135 [Chthoniobacter sp.]|jgi:hypothetical protein